MQKMIRRFLMVSGVPVSCLFCFANNSASAFYLSSGGPEYLGHEAITWYALETASSLAKSVEKRNFFKPRTALLPAFEGPSTAAGVSQLDFFLQGNLSTDWIKPQGLSGPVLFPELHAHYRNRIPDGSAVEGLPVRAHDWNTGDDWTYDANLFPLHFLRNHTNAGQIESMQNACAAGRNHIQMSADRALAAWGNPHLAKMWLGTAIHTIQDSYSQDHTARVAVAEGYDPAQGTNYPGDLSIGADVVMRTDGSPDADPSSFSNTQSRRAAAQMRRRLATNGLTSFRRIVEVCTYGQLVSGICIHGGNPEIRGDSVWDAGWGDISLNNLRPSAQAATFATYVFLSSIYEQAKAGRSHADLTSFHLTFLNCRE